MKEKNNNMVVILMGGIIVILAILCILFVTDTINLDKKVNNNEKNESTIENNNNDIASNNLDIVNNSAKWIFNYINSLNVYCGENMKWGNEDDFIPHENASYIHLYDVSQDFKTISELNEYVKKHISEEMINSYSRKGYSYDLYKEKDGKLYCLNSNKDNGVSYDSEKSSYRIIDSNNEVINVVGNIAYYQTGNDFPSYKVAHIKLNKVDSNWIISSYASFDTELVHEMAIESYLNDIIINNIHNEEHKIVVNYQGKSYNTEEEIKSLSNVIKGIHTSPNGEKWIEPHLEYNSKGFVNKITFA